MLRTASAQAPLRARRRGRSRRAASEPFPLRRGAKLPVSREIHASTLLAAVGLLTIAGAAIRLATTRGLSLDEMTAADQAHLSFGALIARLADASGYPPLHPVLEWITLREIGGSDLALRLPSLIAGVALIPVIAWLAREVFDRRTAVVAALFATVMPILVWYSQEARDYALLALFATLALCGAARIVKRGAPSDWALYTVAAALAVWSDWFGILTVLTTQVGLLVVCLRRRRAREPSRRFVVGWVASTAGLACQFGALGVLAFSQAHHGALGVAGATNVGASAVSFYSVVSNVSWALFGFQPAGVTQVLSAVWPLAMLACLLMVGRGVSVPASALLACAIVPLVALLVLGIAFPGTFDVRYFVASVPPVVVLMARATTNWPRGAPARVAVVATVFVVLTGALVNQQLNPHNPRRYDYHQAFAQVKADANPGTRVLLEPAALGSVLRRYAPGVHGRGLTTRLPTRAQARTVILVISFANRGRVRALRDRDIGALRATRRLIGHRVYSGVDVWRFR